MGVASCEKVEITASLTKDISLITVTLSVIIELLFKLMSVALTVKAVRFELTAPKATVSIKFRFRVALLSCKSLVDNECSILKLELFREIVCAVKLLKFKSPEFSSKLFNVISLTKVTWPLPISITTSGTVSQESITK